MKVKFLPIAREEEPISCGTRMVKSSGWTLGRSMSYGESTQEAVHFLRVLLKVSGELALDQPRYTPATLEMEGFSFDHQQLLALLISTTGPNYFPVPHMNFVETATPVLCI